MASVLFFSALFLVVVILELPPIYKKKQWKIWSIYLIMNFTAYVLIVLSSLDIPIPSPADPIKYVVTSLFNIQVSLTLIGDLCPKK